MQKTYLGIGLITVIMISAVVYAVVLTGSPFKKHNIEKDKARLSQLYSISHSINSYFSVNQKLPDTLAAVGGNAVQYKDPDTNKEYEYKKVDDMSYKLCATFSLSSQDTKGTINRYDEYTIPLTDEGSPGSKNNHKKGYDCLTYTVPTYYLKKQVPVATTTTMYPQNTTSITIPPVYKTSTIKPQVTLSYDGDVVKWNNALTNPEYGAVMLSFKDSKGAQLMGYNAKGITVYRPYFTNWVSVSMLMYIDGYYQPISNVVKNTTYKDCDSSRTSGMCYK